MKKLFLGLIFAVAALAITAGAETFVDTRDGQLYNTVKIGKQEWLAENVRFKTLHSWCYSNDDRYCDLYGRLYTWDAAKTACPAGWHLPQKSEYETLWTAVGGVDHAGQKLKSKEGWGDESNSSLKDEFGFTLQPAGARLVNGNFFLEGTLTGLWTSSKDGKKASWAWFVEGINDYAADISEQRRKGLSVRCVRN